MEHLLKSAIGELNFALQKGDRSKARLLLRLFAALVPSSALHASSVLKALTGIVETAIEIADTGEPQPGLFSCVSPACIGFDRSAK